MKALHSASGTGIGYNPGISYRGGELIGAGLAQAGNALAEGLQQFSKNREEREFADQKMQALASQMGRFQDFEKASNEDDRSPAGQFIKTFANWDNLSLAKKKAALVDAELFVNKREAEQRRAEDQQWRMLGEQRAQEQLGLQRARFGEEQRSNRVREDLAWLNRMDTAGQRVFDNVRAMDADRRAEAESALRMRAGEFNLRQAQQAATLAEQERIATMEAARALLGQTSLAGSPESRLSLGAALPDVKALGGLRDFMQPQAIPGSVVSIPGRPDLTGVVQGRTGGIGVYPLGQPPKADRVRVTTKIGDQTIEREVTPQEADRLLNEARPAPDAKLSGALAELLEMKRNGVKQVKVSSESGKVTADGPLTFGTQPIDQVIARVQGQLGGARAPASAPATMETITTKAQFDALPSGATYKGKDGRTYRKP